MGSTQKQIVFFKAVIAILALVIMAQLSFWFHLYKMPSCSENKPTRQETGFTYPTRKITAPAIMMLDLLNKLR